MQRPTKRLLRDVDPLPYPERMVLLAERTRGLAATGELPGVLADLRGGPTYHRFLGLTAAQVAGDREAVRATLDDPDRALRAVAFRAALRAGWLTGADLLPRLLDAPADLRRCVYSMLRRIRRPEVADALVDDVWQRFGPGEAVALLPACGPETVRRLLPDLDHAVRNWTELARRHGDALLEHAESVLPGLGPAERPRWWVRRAAGILAAGRSRPEHALALLERYGPSDRLPGELTGYGVLAGAAPHRVLALLTAPARAGWLSRVRLPPALLRRLGRLPAVELVELGRRLRGHRLDNEQDPVRAAALAALTGLARLLRADSAEVLTRVAVDATTARDASSRTLSKLGTLAVRVLGHHLDEPALLRWALDTLDRLFGGHRLPPLGRLDETLRRGQEAMVLARLRPWIEAGLARGRFTPLLAVTQALGRRAWRLPELPECGPVLRPSGRG